MTPPTVNDLIHQMRAARLLSDEQLTAVAHHLAPVLTDPRHLLRDLVQRGWLKAEQANLLIQGRAGELKPAAGPEPEIIESGARWRLALILGGVFVVIFIIALATSGGGKKQPGPPAIDYSGANGGQGKTPDWPEDLRPLEGVTETSRDGGGFTGKHTNKKGSDVVTVEGKMVVSDLAVERVVVRQGSARREYRSVEAVPRPYFKIAETLHELGRRELFGTWSH